MSDCSRDHGTPEVVDSFSKRLLFGRPEVRPLVSQAGNTGRVRKSRKKTGLFEHHGLLTGYADG